MTKPTVTLCRIVGKPPKPFTSWEDFFENMWKTQYLYGVEIKATNVMAWSPTTTDEIRETGNQHQTPRESFRNLIDQGAYSDDVLEALDVMEKKGLFSLVKS